MAQELTEYTGPTYGDPYYDIDEVDAVLAEKDAEIRRLKRKYWNDKADEAAKIKRLIYDGEIIYLDEYCNEKDWRIMYKVWEDEETKCRANAYKYTPPFSEEGLGTVI